MTPEAVLKASLKGLTTDERRLFTYLDEATTDAIEEVILNDVRNNTVNIPETTLMIKKYIHYMPDY